MATLKQYLSETGETQAEFAARIGSTQPRVSKYCTGTVPRRKMMERIIDATKGRVTPNDFWGVDP